MGTKSSSGAVIAVVFLSLVVRAAGFPKGLTRANLFKAAAIACLGIVLVFAVFTVGGIREFITSQVDTFWKYKEESARIHFDGSPIPTRVLRIEAFSKATGEGLTAFGKFLLVRAAPGRRDWAGVNDFRDMDGAARSGEAVSRWSTLVLFRVISVLVASIGIPYLKVFPTQYAVLRLFLSACVYAPRKGTPRGGLLPQAFGIAHQFRASIADGYACPCDTQTAGARAQSGLRARLRLFHNLPDACVPRRKRQV